MADKSRSGPKVELILSAGAFVISLIALWISYLDSPLSDATKPNIYYTYIPSREDIPGRPTTAFLTATIENRSRNPAEHLIVTICTLAGDDEPEPPSVIVQTGVEYSVLSRDKNFTSLKFETFPAHLTCLLVINRYRCQPLLKNAPEFPMITSVSHKHGYGIRYLK